MFRPRIFPLTFAAFLLAWLHVGAAWAQGQRISLIRDTEIERDIRVFVTPIFRVAGLNPDDIRIHLINDRRLNAFVAGGLNIFINTGLIQRASHPGQLIGVIAHETGHIAGGHLARVQDELRGASTETIIGLVLGAAAAVATGNPGAMAAGIGAGLQTAQRGLLAYSRGQEASADQAALTFLDRAHESARGLMEFLRVLEDEDLLSRSRQDPYLLTHPITQERVAAVEAHVATSRWSNVPDPPEFVAMLKRIHAKLDGFLDPTGSVLQKYPATDKSIPARYARAIAYYRIPDLAHAMPLVDGLIAERPEDPYFHELKGQILFENGRLAEAVPEYARAVQLLPDAPLIRRDYARTLIETGDRKLVHQAVGDLETVVREDSNDASAWRLLGIAYGRDDNIAMASLALAESAVRTGDKGAARVNARKARELLPKGTPAWLRADDLVNSIKNEREREKR